MKTFNTASARNLRRQIGTLQAWLPSLIFIPIVCTVFSVAFWDEVAGALHVWTRNAAFNHCFLVLPLVLAILWTRRNIVIALRPDPAPGALVLLPLLSAIWVAAALLDVLEVQQLLVLALFETLLLAVLGWQTFRALLAPLLFLFFLVPFGAFLLPILQQITASFVVAGLHLFEIPVFADGVLIEIPAGNFEIAEACAGLRFLIASIVFGCFFAIVMFKSRWRAVAFIGLSAIVPVFANGIRALGIFVFAEFEGAASAAVADHVLYGWIFFTLVILALTLIGMPFADRHHYTPVQSAVPIARSGSRIYAIMAVGLLLTAVGPAYLAIVERTPSELPAVGRTSPQDSAWVREPIEPAAWRPRMEGPEGEAPADREIIETYRDGTALVTQFVAMYRLPARGSGLTKSLKTIADLDTWRVVETWTAPVAIDGMAISVDMAWITRRERRRLVWYFYVVDDRATASTFEAKLLQVRTALAGGDHYGEFIAISTESNDGAAAAATLTRFLKTMGPLQGVRPFRIK